MSKKTRHGLALLSLLIPMAAQAQHCRSSLIDDTSLIACDVSFTGTLPTFACATGGTTAPILGTYTVTNNTPVAIALGTPVLINNDGLSNNNAVISTNTCGSTLAPRASCLITVEITVNEPLNRILEIPVNSRQVVLDSPVITPTGTCTITPVVPPSPALACPLGATSSFGVLAGSAITNTGNTVINGNLGISPNGASSVTGFTFSTPPGPGVVNGIPYFADTTALTAQTDLTALYTCLENLTCTQNIGTTFAGDQIFTSSANGALNVICSTSSLTFNGPGTLTLSGFSPGDTNSVFVFKAASSLTMNNENVALTNGITSANVFWQVGSSATLTPGGATEIFAGTIVALTSISMSAGGGNPDVAMSGRALARNGAVTFIDDTITVPN